MTATSVETARRAPVSKVVRDQVRNRLEQEYLRLRTVDRPALLESLAADETDLADTTAGRALAITDYRLAAIGDFLRAAHDPHPEDAVCRDCCVLVDRGDGPQWFVLAALNAGDLPVIPSDSALGRAVIGARPGQVVHYPDPTGPQAARVLAMESGNHLW